MDYNNIKLNQEATDNLKDMLKFKGDNLSLYTLKLIETYQDNTKI